MNTPATHCNNTPKTRIKALLLAATVAGGLALGACGTGATETNQAVAPTSTAAQASSADTAAAPVSDDEKSYPATETVIDPETGEEVPVVVFEAPSTPEDDELWEDWDENDNPRPDFGHEIFEENGRFGFNHGVPVGMELEKRADNGDGTVWVDPATGVTLAVFGTHSVEESPLNGGDFPMYTHDGVEPLITGYATETYFVSTDPSDAGFWMKSEFNTGEHYVVVEVRGSQDRAAEIFNEAIGSLMLTDPASWYSEQDIATVPEDELLESEPNAENNIEDPRGDQDLGDPWMVINEFYGFSYELEAGFELTNAAESTTGQEHHNKWIDTTVRVYGEFETILEGLQMDDFPLSTADGGSGRLVPLYMSEQRLDNGNLGVRLMVDVGSHAVVVEIEGPDNMVWETFEGLARTITILDQVPMDSPS